MTALLFNTTTRSPNVIIGLSIIANIHKLYTTVVWISVPVYLLGLITNSLNVIIYAMIGFRDNVTICFFALSVCDLCYIVMGNTNNITNILELVNPSFLTNFDDTNNVFAFYASMLLDFSVLIKTFIAVQRGCCVAIPFHANRLFSNKATTAVIVFLCVLCLVPYVSFEFFRFNYYFLDTITNKTFVYHISNKDTALSEKIRYIFNKCIVVFTSEILVFLSLVVIIYGMISATKWRQSLPAGINRTNKQSKPPGRTLKTKLQKQKVESNNINDDQQNLNSASKPMQLKETREVKVIKQVTLVSAVHLICYTPAVVSSLVLFLIQNQSVPFVMIYIQEGLEWVTAFTGSLNAAINFFIYYRYNSKFRQRFSRMCRIVNSARD